MALTDCATISSGIAAISYLEMGTNSNCLRQIAVQGESAREIRPVDPRLGRT